MNEKRDGYIMCIISIKLEIYTIIYIIITLCLQLKTTESRQRQYIYQFIHFVI